MGYFIHAVARTHSVFDDVVVKLPIVICPKVRIRPRIFLFVLRLTLDTYFSQDLSESDNDKNEEEVVITGKENEEDNEDEEQVDKNSDKESEGSENDSGKEESTNEKEEDNTENTEE